MADFGRSDLVISPRRGGSVEYACLAEFVRRAGVTFIREKVMFDLYLACPYSHADKRIRQYRFDIVTIVTGRLMREGLMVFSPISKTHPIAEKCSLPGDWAYWEKYDRIAINHCKELWVLTLDGWRESVGVKAEIAIAEELNKPVIYLAE